MPPSARATRRELRRLRRAACPFILLVAFALAVAGAVAARSLPVGLFPQVAFPRVVVDLDAGSRPADQMALLVTRPVEEAIRTVPGVLDVRSASSRGSAQISIDFGWGRDMVASTLLVDAAIAQILPSLPAGTGYDVRRMDPTVFPIISYALLSDSVSPVALHDLAQYQIVPLLSSIAGLARVDVQGGETAEVEVLADPHRLAAYGLGMTDVADRAAKGNVLQAVGQLAGSRQALSGHRGSARIGTTAAGRRRGGPRRRRRGRAACATSRPCRTASCRNGSASSRTASPPCCSTSMSSRTATRCRSPQAVQAEARRLSSCRPACALANWYDQSELVIQSAGSVRDAVLIGLVLAGAGADAVPAQLAGDADRLLVVPATLATTILLLSVLGMSFNIMTLGGIAAAVGLLIDDVIVMVEHIARRAGAPARARDGAGNAAVLPAGARIPAAADRLEPRDADRLPAAGLPERRHRRLFQGAVGHHGVRRWPISYLMTAFVVPVLARSHRRFRPLARSRAAGRRLARAPAWRLLDGLFRAAVAVRRRAGAAARRRLVRLQCGADGLHAGGR